MLDRFKNTYTIIPIHIFGIWGVYNICTGVAPSWWWLAVIAGYICLKMLGIGALYHRMLSHMAFETPRIVKQFALWCACVSGQGSPIFWVATHRGGHHRFSDKEGDPHSPHHGFWHSYFLWLYTIDYNKINYKSAVNVLRDKDCMFVHNHYNKIFILSHLTVALISFPFWLYFMMVPALITFHSFALQSSVVHYTKLGYKNYDLADDSVNVPWLWPITTGECWHNNHHADPKNINFGHKHWWELDPTYWLILLIQTKTTKTT